MGIQCYPERMEQNKHASVACVQILREGAETGAVPITETHLFPPSPAGLGGPRWVTGSTVEKLVPQGVLSVGEREPSQRERQLRINSSHQFHQIYLKFNILSMLYSTLYH